MSQKDPAGPDPLKEEDTQKMDHENPISQHPADPEKALKHWTPDKMNEAKPAPMPTHQEDPSMHHQDPEKALKHWTADKMRKAKPAPMPKVGKLEPKKKQRSPHTSDPQQS